METKPRRQVRDIIGFRPLETAALIELWIGQNPYTEVAVLIRRSIKTNPEIRKLAGKRFAHLLAA